MRKVVKKVWLSDFVRFSLRVAKSKIEKKIQIKKIASFRLWTAGPDAINKTQT